MYPSSTRHAVPDLAVSVVLFYSPLEQLRALIESLIKAVNEAALQSVELICVDHSDDAEYAEQCHALCATYSDAAALRIKLLVPDVNGGYGAGHNRAMTEVDSRYHLILNPDVELATDAVALALDVLAARESIVLLAPIGLSPSGKPDFLAKAYPSVWVLGLRAFAPRWLKRRCSRSLARYEMRDQSYDAPLRPIELASGCCMWVRRAAFDQVGGFDQAYFLYFEDYDLSLKMTEQGAIMEHQDIHIIHHGGDASRKGLRHVVWFMLGATRFFRRWGWRWFG
jgi:GT2 family glycosyltransferase